MFSLGVPGISTSPGRVLWELVLLLRSRQDAEAKRRGPLWGGPVAGRSGEVKDTSASMLGEKGMGKSETSDGFCVFRLSWGPKLLAA